LTCVPQGARLLTVSRAARHARRGGALISDPDGREALAQVLVANDGEVVSRLRLSAAEAARVCRVTPRQLIYWTKKGLVRPSADSEHDYDVFAMEKVIRIRQALEKGHSLEKAAAIVHREMATIQADVERLATLTAEELELELRRRLERLEERVAALRSYLPASLGIARLRRAVALLARLEAQGSFPASARDGEGTKLLALRLGRAADELEQLLHEVPAAAG
jgi:DNA-binding transcriptional MerR regulator